MVKTIWLKFTVPLSTDKKFILPEPTQQISLDITVKEALVNENNLIALATTLKIQFKIGLIIH